MSSISNQNLLSFEDYKQSPALKRRMLPPAFEFLKVRCWGFMHSFDARVDDFIPLAVAAFVIYDAVLRRKWRTTRVHWGQCVNQCAPCGRDLITCAKRGVHIRQCIHTFRAAKYITADISWLLLLAEWMKIHSTVFTHITSSFRMGNFVYTKSSILASSNKLLELPGLLQSPPLPALQTVWVVPTVAAVHLPYARRISTCRKCFGRLILNGSREYRCNEISI